MEAVTAAQGTGSKTIADLLPLAVEKYGDSPAQRHKVGDEWVDISYAELGETVREVALGLIDLGIEAGDKVSICAHTRIEWTQACFGILTAGGTLVTIYQTNSPEEVQYVLHHSDSRAIFVEDAEQLAKVREVRGECPELRHVIVIDPSGADLGDDAISLEALRERGRGRDAVRVDRPLRGGHARGLLPLHLHLRHDRPAEGLPAHPCQLPRDHGRGGGRDGARGRRLLLPLPTARARVRGADPVRLVRAGRDGRLLVAGPEDDHRRHRAGRPELLPLGPAHVREDLHARHERRRGQGPAAPGGQARR